MNNNINNIKWSNVNWTYKVTRHTRNNKLTVTLLVMTSAYWSSAMKDAKSIFIHGKMQNSNFKYLQEEYKKLLNTIVLLYTMYHIHRTRRVRFCGERLQVKRSLLKLLASSLNYYKTISHVNLSDTPHMYRIYRFWRDCFTVSQYPKPYIFVINLIYFLASLSALSKYRNTTHLIYHN